MATQIQLRRDSAANWAGSDPIMADGEIGVDLDVMLPKIGNGTDVWSVLPFMGGGDAERGGVAYDAANTYVIGDVVVEASVLYRCTAATSGAFAPADWTTSGIGASAAEIGGVLHSAAATYAIGDVVTSGGVAYICTVVPTPNPGAFDVADWKKTADDAVERGGVAYDAATTYIIGDVVVNADIAYRCTAGTTGAFDPLDWTELVSVDGAIMKGNLSYDDTEFTAAIDCSLGNSFSKTVSANFNLSFTNVPATGNACIIVVKLRNGGSKTVSWHSSIDWEGGTAPSLTSSGTDTLVFYTIDGGSTWFGSARLDYS